MHDRSASHGSLGRGLDHIEATPDVDTRVETTPLVDAPASRSAGFAEVLREDARRRSRTHRHGSFAKRGLDSVGALTGLLVMAPVMLAIALALLASRQRPLFVHHRLGVGGEVFPCLKFRSMHPDAEDRLLRLLASDEQAKSEWLSEQKLTNDPRITQLGAFLRRTNLDELPQLINVLVGHMSLVGPRPIVVNEVVRYGTLYPTIATARPGLTGLWQVSGRHRLSYERRVELDLQYVQTASIRTDLWIILRTVGQTFLALLGSQRFGGV